MANNKKVAYSEIKDNCSNIMEIKLENLPAKSEITIVTSFIYKLEVAQNKFWKFSLPTAIMPKFNNDKV